MRQITVNKTHLLSTLVENRDAHRDTFEKAQIIYREQMIQELDRAITEARNGGKITRAFMLPVPEDHTEDFNTAIEMLEWDLGDEVTLSHDEFSNYVQNEWGWQRSFAANTQSYLVE